MGKPNSILYDDFKKGLEGTKKAVSEFDIKQAYLFRMNNIFMKNSMTQMGMERDRFAVSRLPKVNYSDTSWSSSIV